jgi:phosphatidylethanolamine/phosphatidyl-N-methylethanolamine N-methyltransferase
MKQFLADHFEFFRQFRQRFETTGSIAPSSRFLARALCSPLARAGDPQSRRPLRILEVGPGTGAVTRKVVSLLGPNDRLDLVELNPEFVTLLRGKLASQPGFAHASDRVLVHQVPLEEFQSDTAYDFVISGLPLNNFPPDLVQKVFDAYFRLLGPEGTLTYFEYMAIRPLRKRIGPRPERARMSAVDAIIRPHLDTRRVRKDWVFVNFPPAWVQHLQHTADDSSASAS